MVKRSIETGREMNERRRLTDESRRENVACLTVVDGYYYSSTYISPSKCSSQLLTSSPLFPRRRRCTVQDTDAVISAVTSRDYHNEVRTGREWRRVACA